MVIKTKNEIIMVLSKLIILLNNAEDNSWSFFLEKIKTKLINSNSPEDIAREILKTFYGGMCSFSDLVLQKDMKPLVEENNQLEEYREKLFYLCRKIIGYNKLNIKSIIENLICLLQLDNEIKWSILLKGLLDKYINADTRNASVQEIINLYKNKDEKNSFANFFVYKTPKVLKIKNNEFIILKNELYKACIEYYEENSVEKDYLDFNPVNDLEKAIILAINQPSLQLDFYRTLIDSQIYVIPVSDIPDIKNGILRNDTNISLISLEKDGHRFIPFFSSPERASQFANKQFTHIKLDTKVFFEITKGSYLYLNPSNVGKEFCPQEISDLLDGNLFRFQDMHKIEKGGEIIIGQPTHYPHKLESALIEFFTKFPTVRKAYLAQYTNSKECFEPMLLICVDLDNGENLEKIVEDSKAIIELLHPNHKHVDFIRYENSYDGPLGYFNKNVNPFYLQSTSTALLHK